MILLLAAALTGLGLFALGFPVFIDTYDQWGLQIQCGTGYIADLTQAQTEAQAIGTDAVGQCQSALTARRAWTIPMVVIGWLVLTALLVAFLKHASSIEAHHSDQPAA